MKRAIAYLRVSTAKQVAKEIDPEGMSLPVQKQYATEKASQLGAAIEEFYVDRGQSARSMRRDDLQRMVKRLKAGPAVDYVIVLSVNRLARDVGDFNRIWDDIITASGAELVSVLESFDNSPSGRFMAHVLSAKAEYDSAQTAERVKMGLVRKAQIGGTGGRAPIGYWNVTRMVEGRPVKLVEVDDERAPLVREAFHLYATGDWTLETLRDYLTNKGLRTRPGPNTASKPIAISQLSRMLSNRYYTGYISLHGVIYKGRHDALISKQLYERVQAVMTGHVLGERQRTHLHYLKGLVFCNRCGSWMSITVAKGKYWYFFCQGRAKRHGCDQPFIAVHDVELAVDAELAKLAASHEDVERAQTSLREYLASERAEHAEDETRQRAILAKLAQERGRLVQAHLAGAIPLDVLKVEQDRLMAEIGAAEARLAVVSAEHKDAETVFAEASTLLTDPAGLWKKLGTDQERRQFILTFFTDFKIDGSRIASSTLMPAMRVLTEGVENTRTEYHRQRGGLQFDHRWFIPQPETANPRELAHTRVRLNEIWSG